MTNETVRAEHAKRLLADELLTEILDSIEQDAIDDWATTGMEAVELREMAYQKLKASRRLRDKLKGVVDNGLIAANRAIRP